MSIAPILIVAKASPEVAGFPYAAGPASPVVNIASNLH